MNCIARISFFCVSYHFTPFRRLKLDLSDETGCAGSGPRGFQLSPFNNMMDISAAETWAYPVSSAASVIQSGCSYRCLFVCVCLADKKLTHVAAGVFDCRFSHFNTLLPSLYLLRRPPSSPSTSVTPRRHSNSALHPSLCCCPSGISCYQLPSLV